MKIQTKYNITPRNNEGTITDVIRKQKMCHSIKRGDFAGVYYVRVNVLVQTAVILISTGNGDILFFLSAFLHRRG